MATASTRALWKGAISFGLVHIPIALHSATQDQALDFDWLDKRSMDPVGYKRINKVTGKTAATATAKTSNAQASDDKKRRGHHAA